MSKKNKKRKAKIGRPSAPARFSPGDRVRVQRGTADPDFPDFPLGGWSGTILDVNTKADPPTCLIEWDRRTLAAMHPIYLQRCARDDLEVERMWLGENDLEPDAGAPTPIEQPTAILTRPLNMDDPSDRVRAIFGRTSDDPLPDVDEESLRQFHTHLARKLAFPFSAAHPSGSNAQGRRNQKRITVTALLDPDESDEEDGLLCEARAEGESLMLPLALLENVGGDANRRLVEDYCEWFWNGSDEESAGRRSDQEIPSGDDEVPHTPELTPGILAFLYIQVGLFGGFYGAVLGAALTAVEETAVAVKVGAILLAVVGALLGAQAGPSIETPRLHRPGSGFGMFVGLILGALIGAMLGAMLAAFLATLTGAILGGILGRLLGSAQKQPSRTLFGAAGGAMLGVGIRSWMHDADAAWSGAWIGGAIGALAGPALFFLTTVVWGILDGDRE